MKRVLPRGRYGDLALLATLAVTVLALGLVIARNLQQSAADASRSYDRLVAGLELIDELQFSTQEVRRIMLYALHTQDANQQLAYAEQSRAAQAQVERLLREPRGAVTEHTRQVIQDVARAWDQYVRVRDEEIGLILEGSLQQGVELDQQRGTERFNEVRRAIARLQVRVEESAADQLAEAHAQVRSATLRVTLLVGIALAAAAIGLHLVNRRAVLERVLRSEAHRGAILQAVPDPIVSVDAGRRIIEFNQAAEQVFGVARAEALGRRFKDLVLAPSAREALADAWARGARAGGSPRVVTIGRHANGTEFPIEVAVATHEVGDDWISTVHISDLRGRRQVEEELRRAKDAAEVAARAKSEFLATMSHELRTPLSGVIGITDLLHGSRMPQGDRDLLRMLRSSATALFGLVSDILDYSRIEDGQMTLEPTWFQLHDCLESSIDAVTEAAARKGLEIGYVIEAGVPGRVFADEDRVRQVLLNLLANAVKFTDAGEIAVRVACTGDGETATIAVRVRDTGAGIPEHAQQNLFKRFSQLDSTAARRHGGAGLGLAISERLARLLGGSLTVESREGAGATFTFVFTARAQHASDAAAATPPRAAVRTIALMRPGIVADQVAAMMASAAAGAVVVADPAAFGAIAQQPGDVLLVDADTFDPATRAAAIAEARRRGMRVIVAARLRTGGMSADGGADHVLAKPIRRGAMIEALGVAPAEADAAAPIAGERFARDAMSILLVEDNDANRRVVRMMLEELGLAADEAASGFEAIERVHRRDYDVILMDVQMPVLDGLETTRRIRAERRDRRPAIVALTANVMQGDEARCREAGMDGYLPKPLRLEALAAFLSSLAAPKA